jgi:glycolate oxidase FAD binding subunit
MLSFEPRFVAEAIADRLRPTVTAAGGRMIVEAHPPRAALDCPAVWGPPGDCATVMRAIKDRFDPRGILNPGRFVYGS